MNPQLIMKGISNPKLFYIPNKTIYLRVELKFQCFYKFLTVNDLKNFFTR